MEKKGWRWKRENRIWRRKDEKEKKAVIPGSLGRGDWGLGL